MSDHERRDFLKKMMLGGLAFSSGLFYRTEGTPIGAHEFQEINTLGEAKVNWNKIRKLFGFNSSIHHFNTAGLGPTLKMVYKKMETHSESWEEQMTSGHSLGINTNKTLAKFLNTDYKNIAITRNTTEGMNIIARSIGLKKGDEVILTRHEHVGGAAPWLALQKETGITIKLVELDLSGETNLRIIENALTKNTKAVSVSHVTCTTGMRLPAKEIAALCRERGIYSCLDGAQAIGMINVDLEDIKPDFYAGSGHKWLFGPKGSGFLFINPDLTDRISPVFAGAYTDEFFDLDELKLDYRPNALRQEYGTRDNLIKVGLSEAVEFVQSIGMDKIEARGKEFCRYLRSALASNPGIEILTPENEAFSGAIVTFMLKDKDYSDVVAALHQKGYRCRGIYEHNLRAIRISCAIFNTTKEIDRLVEEINQI